MATIKSIYKWKKENQSANNNLFGGGDTSLSGLVFMQNYLTSPDNLSDLDLFILTKFGNREFDSLFHEDENLQYIVSEWDKMTKSYIFMKSENLQKIYDALRSDYNPIENYDKISEIRTKREGDTNIRTGSESSETAFLGEEERKNTRTGSESNVEQIGQSASDLSNGRNAWDSNESTEMTTSHSTSDEQRNETTTTFNSVMDTEKTSFENRKNETENNYNIKDSIDTTETINEHTHGNIGTLTTMKMLSETFEGLFDMDVLKNLFIEIVFEFTY